MHDITCEGFSQYTPVYEMNTEAHVSTRDCDWVCENLTGLTYVHSVKHIFHCEQVNNPKFAPFTVLSLVSLVSSLYTYSLPTGQVQSDKK